MDGDLDKYNRSSAGLLCLLGGLAGSASRLSESLSECGDGHARRAAESLRQTVLAAREVAGAVYPLYDMIEHVRSEFGRAAVSHEAAGCVVKHMDNLARTSFTLACCFGIESVARGIARDLGMDDPGGDACGSLRRVLGRFGASEEPTLTLVRVLYGTRNVLHNGGVVKRNDVIPCVGRTYRFRKGRVMEHADWCGLTYLADRAIGALADVARSDGFREASARGQRAVPSDRAPARQTPEPPRGPPRCEPGGSLAGAAGGPRTDRKGGQQWIPAAACRGVTLSRLDDLALRADGLMRLAESRGHPCTRMALNNLKGLIVASRMMASRALPGSGAAGSATARATEGPAECLMAMSLFAGGHFRVEAVMRAVMAERGLGKAKKPLGRAFKAAFEGLGMEPWDRLELISAFSCTRNILHNAGVSDVDEEYVYKGRAIRFERGKKAEHMAWEGAVYVVSEAVGILGEVVEAGAGGAA